MGIKIYRSTQVGAPQVSGTAGTLIELLDAVLVNGFNSQSLTSLEVAGGIGHAVKANHGYIPGDLVQVSGATPFGANGTWRVVSADIDSFDLSMAGVSNGACTGTIVACVAPLGWSKPLSGTDKAAYMQGDLDFSSGSLLRIDDSADIYAVVVGYESMTDIDTGVNKFPLDVQMPDGLVWKKSDSAGVGSRPWIIVGDESGFYLFVQWFGDFPGFSSAWYFGDVASWRIGDANRCAITGLTTSAANYPGNDCASMVEQTDTGVRDNNFLARGYHGAAGAVSFGQLAVVGNAQGYSGFSNSSAACLNPTDGALVLSPALIREAVTYAIRGQMPGKYMIPHRRPAAHGAVFGNPGGLPGRDVMLVVSSQYGANDSYNAWALDITGPWRTVALGS